MHSGETGGQSALGSQGQPFSQPLREAAVARLMSGSEGKSNSLLDISTPFISTRHHQTQEPQSPRIRHRAGEGHLSQAQGKGAPQTS